jgi:iron complex outermembrane recepter protein
MSTRKYLFIAGTLALTTIAHSQVTSNPGGQSATQTNSAAAEGATGLEEIVVTAQKRTESLQSVPVAISAFTDKTRDLIGINTLQDFTNYTPGITYSTSTDRMFSRGIGRYSNTLSISPGIASYGDGFYNYSNHQADQTTLFTERVEVLRGPQGTLYGRNSLGGAINVITRRPGDEFGGEIRVSDGNYQSHKIEGLLWAPLTDWAKASIGGGRYQQNQGYINNIGGGQDGFGRRDNNYAIAQLSLKFGDYADVWFKFQHSEWTEGHQSAVTTTPYSYNLVPVVNNGLSNSALCTGLICTGAILPAPAYNTAPGLFPSTPPYTVVQPGTSYGSRNVNTNLGDEDTLNPDNILVLEAIAHLGWADLKYLGGYHYYNYALTGDQDNTNRASYQYQPLAPGSTPVTIYTDFRSLYEENNRIYSNELNLTSTGDGNLQWIAGLYSYYNNYNQPVTASDVNQTQLATPIDAYSISVLHTVVPAAPNPNLYYSYTNAYTTNKSNAVFGQVDWKFLPDWKATLGLRYTSDVKYSNEFYRLVEYNPTVVGNGIGSSLDLTRLLIGNIPGAHALPDGRWTRYLSNPSHAVSGTTGVEWHPTTDMLAYLHYTRGYKDASINAGSIVAKPYADPEFTDAYEFGWKQTIAHQFTIDSSVFFYNNKNAQIPLTSIPLGGTPITQTFNIDNHSYGIENEATWRPLNHLQVLADYSYLRAMFHNGQCFTDTLDTIKVGAKPCANAAGVIDGKSGESINGDRVPGSPVHKASLTAVYSWEFTPGNVSLSSAYNWRSAAYSNIFTRNEYKIPAFGQADFRLTYTDKDNRYTVFGYLRNAFNTLGYDGVAAGLAGGGFISEAYSLTPPRNFGVELQYRFGSAAR